MKNHTEDLINPLYLPATRTYLQKHKFPRFVETEIKEKQTIPNIKELRPLTSLAADFKGSRVTINILFIP